MATELKRMTFVVTANMQPLLDEAKKEMFYNRSHSDMIRELVEAGLRVLKKDPYANNTTPPNHPT